MNYQLKRRQQIDIQNRNKIKRKGESQRDKEERTNKAYLKNQMIIAKDLWGYQIKNIVL